MQLKVNESLLIGITAVGLMTLVQVGFELQRMLKEKFKSDAAVTLKFRLKKF